MKIKFASAAAVVSLVCTQGALAHHSFAMFDNQRQITLTGTVKSFQWTNPHAWLELIVKDPATGKDADWSIEAGSVSTLKGMGWTRTSVKPGDKVEVVIHPMKDGTAGGSLVSAAIDDQTIGHPQER